MEEGKTMTIRCLNLRGPRSAARPVAILVLLLVALVGLAPLPARAAPNRPAQGQPAHRLATHGAPLPPGLAAVLSQQGLLAAAQAQQYTQQQKLQGNNGAP